MNAHSKMKKQNKKNLSLNEMIIFEIFKSFDSQIMQITNKRLNMNSQP